MTKLYFFIHQKTLCKECGIPFCQSKLRETFDCLICDGCYDKDKFPLMTKSEIRKEYLLTDKLIEQHNLKFELRKNPHNAGWGMMNLFLVRQVEELALNIYGSWEKLDEEKEKRAVTSTQRKQKLFDRKLEKMRRDATAKKYRKPQKEHEHTFDKVEDLGDDKFRKTCSDCGLSVEYEEF